MMDFMRKIKFAPLLMLAILLTLSGGLPAASLRCGGRLVSEGDTKAEVVAKCGEPDYVDAWEEERIKRDYYSYPRFKDEYPESELYREPRFVKEFVRIEVWTYNLGSTRFIRYLRFENGRLVKITLGNYGY